MRRETQRRLEGLERKLRPARVYWCEWQRVLDDDEHGLALALASRGARHGGDHTSEEARAKLANNLAQRGTSTDYLAARLKRDRPELLGRVRRVVEANPDLRNRSGWRDEFWEYLTDLQL